MNAYLTRITPNPADRTAHTELGDADLLHRRLMRMLPDGLGEHARQQTGLLFRVEETLAGRHILMQTRIEPDLAALPSGYGDTEARDLSPLLERLRDGARVQYRITANPTKRNAVGKAAGKVTVLNGPAAEEWWTAKAAACGLTVGDVAVFTLPDAIGKKRSRDPRTWIRHGLRRFDGVATVTNAEALREAVLCGVGRAKSYGAGLLSLKVLA